MVAAFFGIGSTLYVYALTMGNVASVSVLCATSPFFAAVLAWLVMRERTSAVSLGATVVALVGVAIVVQAEMSALATGLRSPPSFRWAWPSASPARPSGSGAIATWR